MRKILRKMHTPIACSNMFAHKILCKSIYDDVVLYSEYKYVFFLVTLSLFVGANMYYFSHFYTNMFVFKVRYANICYTCKRFIKDSQVQVRNMEMKPNKGVRTYHSTRFVQKKG
jgi:hypothetical protein